MSDGQGPFPSEQRDSFELTISDIFAIFRRRFWWGFVTAFCVVLATGIYLLVTTPVYESSVTIRIDASTGSGLENLLTSVPFSLGGGGSNDVTTEIEMILSRTNLEKVVERLNLVSILIPADSEERKKRTPEQLKYLVVNQLSQNLLTVTPVKNTSIVQILVSYEDPILATQIANTLAQVYSDQLYQVSKQESLEKLSFIEDQLPQAQKELEDSQNALREFKEKNGIFLISEEAGALLDVVSDFDKQINQKKFEIQTTQAAITVLREKLQGTQEKLISSETITVNPLVSELRSTISTYNIELATLQRMYPSTDPRVIQKKKQIEEAQVELSQQVTNIVSAQTKVSNPIYSTLLADLVSNEIQYQLGEATLEAMEKTRSEYMVRLYQLPAMEQQLTELMREMKFNEEVYLTLQKSYTESRIAEAAIMSKTYIVDPAVVPLTPAKPNKKLGLAIGMVLGLFLAMLVAFVVEFLDKKINTEGQLNQLLGGSLPVLGRIPKTDWEKDPFPVKTEPFCAIAEEIGNASVEILFSKSPKSIAFLSP
ncbi:MAG TPA: GumC family protein, partial [Thermotogota bacterium]|nr:GumC family protein [Thermotogota bacterium]